jgi:hypothetical protein
MTRPTVTCRHEGGRIVASVPTRDHYSRDLGTRRSRDSTLQPVPVGHILDQGIVWSGDLEGRAVRALDEVRQLSTPLTDPRIGGRKLTAEGPGKVLNLADVYDGLARAARGDQEGGLAQVERAVADAKRRKATGDSADWGERAVARARLVQEDACAQMRAGADKLWSTDAEGAAAPPAASGSRPTPAEQNEINRRFWANRS